MELTQDQIDKFLQAETADWLNYAEAVLKGRLSKQRLVDTKTLMDSIKGYYSKPIKNNTGTLTISFVDYGRIIDILGYRVKTKSLDVFGKPIRTKRGVKVKNKKWYSRTKMGIILNLAERLVTTEAEIIAAGIAQEITQSRH